MTLESEQLVRKAASCGKYAPLYRHLATLAGKEWRVSFGEIESVLGSGFRTPRGSTVHGGRTGRGVAATVIRLPGRLPAGRRGTWTSRRKCFVSRGARGIRNAANAENRPTFLIDELLPAYDPGPWPEGFTTSRSQIYNFDDR